MGPKEKTNILLVDDRPENLLALEAVLEKLGQNLVTASSGEEALMWVLREDFAVILLDVQMPGMSGLETARIIKQRDRSRTIPIIFLTAINQDAPHVCLGYSVGAVDYLFKPFDPQILRSKVAVFVDLALKNRRLMEQARALERAYQELREMDRYKDEFLSVVSHELRTPLNAVMGFGEILKDEAVGRLNPEQHVYVQQMLVGAERILALVNDLLDVATLQAGKLELHVVPSAYAPVVQEVLAEVRPLAREKGLLLEADVQAPASVPLDAAQIAHVLRNLVSNAIKFTPEGGTIEVKVYPQERELVTEVRDSGIGFAEEEISSIFTCFRQLDMSNTRSAGGVGLGLCIAKALVEAHGGVISAMSAGHGKGSVFRFTLPLGVPAPPEAPRDPVTPPGEQA